MKVSQLLLSEAPLSPATTASLLKNHQFPANPSSEAPLRFLATASLVVLDLGTTTGALPIPDLGTTLANELCPMAPPAEYTISAGEALPYKESGSGKYKKKTADRTDVLSAATTIF